MAQTAHAAQIAEKLSQKIEPAIVFAGWPRVTAKSASTIAMTTAGTSIIISSHLPQRSRLLFRQELQGGLWHFTRLQAV
jgi:hypothetical protein